MILIYLEKIKTEKGKGTVKFLSNCTVILANYMLLTRTRMIVSQSATFNFMIVDVSTIFVPWNDVDTENQNNLQMQVELHW